MSHRLVILPDAEAEVAAAVAWYESRRSGLGIELFALADQVFFTMTDTEVRIVAFAHSKRRPGHWLDDD